ncbi:insulin-like peptide INSL5 isoform X1 [Podarcis raffonei]|uniref:insulin-like peptide INSL5 isoform X1 n=2 Tax=Podarcis raffonei TaxID=65483 RepID=UPI0023296470|nr:insulin-like peptide INSL5 isoform X1 [Podarcis raffonei]
MEKTSGNLLSVRYRFDKMKAAVLGMLLLSLFMAISEVAAERRLCGRDLVRAVVFTCGGSRWRRQLTHFPKSLTGQESHLNSPLDTNDSTGANEKVIQKPEYLSKEFIQSSSEAEGDLWGMEQKSIHKRNEDIMRLIDLCCLVGCSDSTVSSLC